MKYTLEQFSSGMHYILIDNKVANRLLINDNKRAICKLNDEIEFHCALMKKKEGGYFINIGSAICKKLKIKKGSLVIATFKIDKSKYQFEIPEEFEEVLKTDKKANSTFENLTDGNKRGIIYLVSKVKSVEKRIEKSLRIAEYLKTGITSPRQMK